MKLLILRLLGYLLVSARFCCPEASQVYTMAQCVLVQLCSVQAVSRHDAMMAVCTA